MTSDIDQTLLEFATAHDAAQADYAYELAVRKATEMRAQVSQQLRDDAKTNGEKVTEGLLDARLTTHPEVCSVELAVVETHHAQRRAYGHFEVARERLRFARITLQRVFALQALGDATV